MLLALTACGSNDNLTVDTAPEAETRETAPVDEDSQPPAQEGVEGQAIVMGQISELTEDELALALFENFNRRELPEGAEPPAEGELPEGVEPQLSGKTLTLTITSDALVYLSGGAEAETGSLDDLNLEDMVMVTYDESDNTVLSTSLGMGLGRGSAPQPGEEADPQDEDLSM